MTAATIRIALLLSFDTCEMPNEAIDLYPATKVCSSFYERQR